MPQPPNLNALLQQAQKMQADMMAAQEKLKDETVEASAGGGMVKVTMSGDLELKALTIDPDAVDPEDVEMLQDMVMAAINEALRQAMELQAASTGMGGMDPTSALDGGELTLSWAESAAFYKRKAEDPACREQIATAIRTVTGSSLRLAYALADDELLRPEETGPIVSDDELIERFMQEFDAEELPAEEES